MKKSFFILSLVMLSSAALFARGISDETTDQDYRQGGYRSSLEEVTLSGTIEEKDGGVFLKTKDGEYSLGAPGFYRYGIDIPAGENVTVEGQVVYNNGDEKHLLIQTAKYNGKEYTFSNGRPNDRGQMADNRNNIRAQNGHGGRGGYGGGQNTSRGGRKNTSGRSRGGNYRGNGYDKNNFQPGGYSYRYNADTNN